MSKEVVRYELCPIHLLAQVWAAWENENKTWMDEEDIVSVNRLWITGYICLRVDKQTLKELGYYE